MDLLNKVNVVAFLLVQSKYEHDTHTHIYIKYAV